MYGPERLPSGTSSASPILADGKIYVTTEEEGLTSEGQIFMRTSSYLWAIGQRKAR